MKVAPFAPELRRRATEARRAIRTEIDRVRVARRVFLKTGLTSDITARGAALIAEAAVQGRANPAFLFRWHATNSPDKTALVHRDRSWTFRELDAWICRLALGLKRRGVTRGSSAILMLENRAEFIAIQPAMSRLGGAAVSVSWRSTAAELVFLVRDSGSRLVFFDAKVAPVIEAALAELPDLPRGRFVSVGGRIEGFPAFEDLLADELDETVDEDEQGAVVIYTSGTTGKPKGAVRKFNKASTPAALRFIGETPMRADDVHLVACPLYHSTAYGFLNLSYALGNSAVLLDHFDPTAFLEAVERHRVTQTALVPTMLHRLLALGPEVIARYDTRSLRVVFSGGAPLPGPLAIEFMDAFGDVLFNFYGATETGLVTLARPADLRNAPGTIGRVVPGNEVRLLDDDGREAPRGQVGELWVRNDLLVEGYHRNEAATRESMRDGFFSVGDLAREDEAGRLFLEGRKRDMIISGGVNVYPAEVESVLEAHPHVAEVAVVGVPDPEWGEKVKAFVALRPGAPADEAALRAFCRERLAGPKNPREYAFVDQLPRNPTGKVLKRELREGSPAPRP